MNLLLAKHDLVTSIVVVAGFLWVNQPTLRELVFFAAGGVCAVLALRGVMIAAMLWLRRPARSDRGGRETAAPRLGLNEAHIVADVGSLRRAIPAGLSGTNVADAPKVIGHLDEQMQGFISRSPFLQLATVDAAGQPFVSPKGDAAGFVQVVTDDAGRGVALRIPDRPGNRLLFGLQNVLLGSGRVGLCFEIPGNDTTLRCGGRAVLSVDPALLAAQSARGVAAKMVMQVHVEHAFFHCSKAYMRARLWDPASWPNERYKVCFGPYFHRRNQARSDALDAAVETHYAEVAQAVRGERAEPD